MAEHILESLNGIVLDPRSRVGDQDLVAELVQFETQRAARPVFDPDEQAMLEAIFK